MHAQRKEKTAHAQRQVVNLSAQAQQNFINYVLPKTGDAPFRATQEMFLNSTIVNVTTTASAEHEMENVSLTKSMMQDQDGLQLPNINSANARQSPFKGFLDISIVQQKLRKAMKTEIGQQRGVSYDVQRNNNNTQLDVSDPFKMELIQPKNTRFKQTDKQVQMSPKVLETWINETLMDAEHLDIPGVILKPEHKNPISRYGIDRMAFSSAGIPTELVDRVYRALFVYSVGFYELIKRCLQHTDKKYTLITNIWKVFAILLEYCCRTDYRMLVSEISKEHKAELEKLDHDYSAKFQEQAQHEKILRETNETLTKYAEELERERANEKQMRLKLEEDYAQNTKNHEEEVQLRLKFESKLNNMHSAHRDLESKYKRIITDFANANKQLAIFHTKLQERNQEVTTLKTIKAENEATMSQDKEEIASAKRELIIKAKQLKDVESRCQIAINEVDGLRYRMQELQRDNTEMKLKIDVQLSSIDGHKSEIKHQSLELKETRELLKIYEQKCDVLIEQLTDANAELNSSKRLMIGITQTQEEQDEKISFLKTELSSYKLKSEELHLQLGTLQIHHEKLQDQQKLLQATYDDTVDKLHQINKARHDLETKLTDEIERNRSLQDIIRTKEDQVIKRQHEIEDQDRKIVELERNLETVDIKKQSVERQFELFKKQQADQITNLNETISQEKETRDMWIERYEKEQREHNKTQGELLQARSELKDVVLSQKSTEIKLNTANRQIQMLQEQTVRFQHQVNDTLSRSETLDRELSTQREIMKQMEISRKEYIEKLKTELDTVEERWARIADQNAMLGEDYRSQAMLIMNAIGKLNQTVKHRDDTIEEKIDFILQLEEEITQHKTDKENMLMGSEDLLQVVVQRNQQLDHLADELRQMELKLIQNGKTAILQYSELQRQFDQYVVEHTPPECMDQESQTLIGEDYFNSKQQASRRPTRSNNAKQLNSSNLISDEQLTSRGVLKDGISSKESRAGLPIRRDEKGPDQDLDHVPGKQLKQNNNQPSGITSADQLQQLSLVSEQLQGTIESPKEAEAQDVLNTIVVRQITGDVVRQISGDVREVSRKKSRDMLGEGERKMSREAVIERKQTIKKSDTDVPFKQHMTQSEYLNKAESSERQRTKQSVYDNAIKQSDQQSNKHSDRILESAKQSNGFKDQLVSISMNDALNEEALIEEDSIASELKRDNLEEVQQLSATVHTEPSREEHKEQQQRTAEIERIYQQVQRVPAGSSNIRKLIKMKATI